MPDEAIDTSDIPELDQSFFKSAEIRLPKSKAPVTIRLDQDVLDWYRSLGKGYQTKINAILRLYMDANKGRSSTSSDQRNL